MTRFLLLLVGSALLLAGFGGAGRAQSSSAPDQSAGQPAPGQTNPAQTDPAQTNPAQTNPAQNNPAQNNPAQTNPDQTNPAQKGPAQPAPEPSSLPLPPAEPKPLTPPKPVEKPAKLEHMQKAQAESIIGEAVLDAKGDRIGRIVDVLVNPQGIPHAAVIEFAGFLGVGNRNIAVEWKALHFAVVKSQIVIRLDLEAAKLKAMPPYTADAKSVPVAAAGKAKAGKAKAGKPKPAPAKAPEASGKAGQPEPDHQGTAASPAGAQ